MLRLLDTDIDRLFFLQVTLTVLSTIPCTVLGPEHAVTRLKLDEVTNLAVTPCAEYPRLRCD